MKLSALLRLFGTSVVSAQSFLSATGAYPQLSQFRQLLINQPNIAGLLLATTNGTNDNQTTVLVPNNNAFDNYHRNTGQYVEGLQSSDLTDLVHYHSLNGALSSSDLQKPTGLVASTSLTDPRYDNRGLGSNGAMQSQVVYVGSNSANQPRQNMNSSGLYVQSGLVSNSPLNTIDGTWDGGLFHIVDDFFVLPQVQTNTMTAFGVLAFVEALNRTNTTSTINSARGFTALCPSDQAFASLSNLNGDIGSLLAILTRHFLNSSYYSTDFRDGDLFYSESGYPILVSVKNGSIYLNDAKVIASNFITQNGAMHALDRIMGALNTTTNVTTPANSTQYPSSSAIPSLPPVSVSVPSVPSVTAIPTATATSSKPATVTTNAGTLAQVPRYPLSFTGMVLVALGGILL